MIKYTTRPGSRPRKAFALYFTIIAFIPTQYCWKYYNMDQYFIISSQWNVIICVQCQHAIRPEDVLGHLTGFHHQLPKAENDLVKQELAQSTIIQNMLTFEPISGLDEPIPGLKIYNNGFMCATDPACTYSALKDTSIKQHFATKHLGVRKRSSYSKQSDQTSWIKVQRC